MHSTELQRIAKRSIGKVSLGTATAWNSEVGNSEVMQWQSQVEHCIAMAKCGTVREGEGIT